ncbi:MAG: c-type cytochrome [Desulfobacteraceae bacterium]|jgi:mono/diheme cytochrome c family protein
MHSRFYLSLLLVSALVIFAFTGLAVNRELSNEWHQHQSQYKEIMLKNAKSEVERERAAAIETGMIRQVFLPSLNKSDRCMSCHMGLENPLMADGELPYKQHSGDFLKTHSVAKFGCTVCHLGQGRATNMREAHGLGHTFWDYPIIPHKYIQSSCAVCHDYKMLEEEGMHTVVEGERLFREKGCLGCHKLNGVGGDLGAALDGVASRPLLYFPMANVIGDRTAYNWVKQHFDDPRAIVPGSEMKVSLTDEEAEQLTTHLFTLRKEEMPSNYKLIKNIPTKEKDGDALFKMYCTGCHGTGKQSIYDEVLDRTIPAIANPGFLRLIDDFTLKVILDEGRPGTQMTAWKASVSGLKKEALEQIVDFVSESRPSFIPVPFDYNGKKSDPARGQTVYEQRCNFCHGDDGKGGGRLLGINLRNSTVQTVLKPEFLAQTVLHGRQGTPMPSFGPEGEGLNHQEISDVVAYVKTLAKKKTQ